jgi:hypothetical protein
LQLKGLCVSVLLLLVLFLFSPILSFFVASIAIVLYFSYRLYQKDTAAGIIILVSFFLIVSVHLLFSGLYLTIHPDLESQLQLHIAQNKLQAEPWHTDEIRDVNIALAIDEGGHSLLKESYASYKPLFYILLHGLLVLLGNNIILAYVLLPALAFFVFQYSMYAVVSSYDRRQALFFIALLPLATNNVFVTGFWFFIGFTAALAVWSLFALSLVKHSSKSIKICLLIFAFLIHASLSLWITLCFFVWIVVKFLSKRMDSLRSNISLYSSVLVLIFILHYALVKLNYFIALDHKQLVLFWQFIPWWIIVLGTLGVVISSKKKNINLFIFALFSTVILMWGFGSDLILTYFSENKLAILFTLFFTYYASISFTYIYTKYISKKAKTIILLCFAILLATQLISYHSVDSINLLLHDIGTDDKLSLLKQYDGSTQLLVDTLTAYYVPFLCMNCLNVPEPIIFEPWQIPFDPLRPKNLVHCSYFKAVLNHRGATTALVPISASSCGTIIVNNSNYAIIQP